MMLIRLTWAAWAAWALAGLVYMEGVTGTNDSSVDLATKSNYSLCIDCKGTNQGQSKRLFYIKTHKTGSSTLTGVLWRELCLDLGFNCFVPPSRKAGKTWDWQNSIDKLYIQSSKGSGLKPPPYDAWIHHIRYQREPPASLVQAPYLLVSSVRRPAYRFLSAWYWYGLETEVGMNITSFIDLYGNQTNTPSLLAHMKRLSYRTRLDATSEELLGLELHANPMVFSKRLHDYLIPMIRSHDIFLVVCDRFEESLLLLQHLLRFHSTSYSDNQWMFWPQKVQSVQRSVLTTEQVDALDEMQPHDLLLYHEANQALDRLIKRYGSKQFHSDIEAYKHRLQIVQEGCAGNSSRYEKQEIQCELLRRDNREAIQSYWESHK